MKTSQPQLPAMPPDFTKPIECRGGELAATIAQARAAGYHAHRMTVLPEVVYRLQFFRLDATTPSVGTPAHVIAGDQPPEKSKESFLMVPEQGH